VSATTYYGAYSHNVIGQLIGYGPPMPHLFRTFHTKKYKELTHRFLGYSAQPQSLMSKQTTRPLPILLVPFSPNPPHFLRPVSFRIVLYFAFAVSLCFFISLFRFLSTNFEMQRFQLIRRPVLPNPFSCRLLYRHVVMRTYRFEAMGFSPLVCDLLFLLSCPPNSQKCLFNRPLQ